MNHKDAVESAISRNILASKKQVFDLRINKVKINKIQKNITIMCFSEMVVVSRRHQNATEWTIAETDLTSFTAEIKIYLKHHTFVPMKDACKHKYFLQK